jgi:hypothetical protein
MAAFPRPAAEPVVEADCFESFVDAVAASEHVNVFGDSAGARLGSFGVVDAPDDRVTILGIKLRERGRHGGVAVELAGEVVGDFSRALSVIGGVPPSVGLGAFDIGQSCGSHPAVFDQLLGPVTVDLRPPAAAGARREALEPVVVVVSSFLAVDPPEAQRDLDRIWVGNGSLACVFLGDLKPHARAVGRRLSRTTHG